MLICVPIFTLSKSIYVSHSSAWSEVLHLYIQLWRAHFSITVILKKDVESTNKIAQSRKSHKSTESDKRYKCGEGYDCLRWRAQHLIDWLFFKTWKINNVDSFTIKFQD